MKYTIKPLSQFMKAAKRLKKRYASFNDDYERLLDRLEADPTLGTSLGNNMRKIRMGVVSKGKGRRGGLRVVTYTAIVAIEETNIYLVYIYDKSERNNVTEAELKMILKRNNLL